MQRNYPFLFLAVAGAIFVSNALFLHIPLDRQTASVEDASSTSTPDSTDIETGYFFVRPPDKTYGTGDGSDWDNAFSGLPATLKRGSIYYVAPGVYPSYTFDDAEDGTKVITIKKATANVGGWTGDSGQAIFSSPIAFKKGYYEWNGTTGSGKDASSYGFAIKVTGSCATRQDQVQIPLFGDSVLISNIGIFHTEIENCGSAYDQNQNSIRAINSTNVSISNNFLHNSGHMFLVIGADYWTIENNYMKDNWSSAANHGEAMSLNGHDSVVSNNVFENAATQTWGTGVISWGQSGNARWKVYNNVVIGGTVSNGVFGSKDSATPDVFLDMDIYSNTIINVTGIGYGSGIFTGTTASQQSRVFNNLWIDSVNANMNGNIAHDYNACFECANSNISSEAHGQIAEGDPLVDSLNGDFHLKQATNAGLMAEYPYNIDPDNTVRGTDGTWDIGAYEYQESSINSQDAVPLNGLCSDIVNKCTAGSFTDTIDADTNSQWSCMGLNGGTTASCSVPFVTQADSTSTLVIAISALSIFSTSAVITWSTSEPATTQVQYGLTTAYGNSTSADSTKVTSHSVTLSNITPNTLYHYRVISINEAGNAAVSDDATFVTEAAVTTSSTGEGNSSTSAGSSGKRSSSSGIFKINYNNSTENAIVSSGIDSGASLPISVASCTPAITFTRSLPLGSRGDDVKRLQIFLNTHGYAIAATGAGSSGHETTYFGEKTRQALVSFQRVNHITPAVGYFGPVTRERIAALSGTGSSQSCIPVTSYTGTTLIRSLTLGSSGADVKSLQIFLNSHGYLVSSAGAGSPGYETSYFGEKTRQALASFQKANRITPAVGYFGPVTRGRVNAIGNTGSFKSPSDAPL